MIGKGLSAQAHEAITQAVNAQLNRMKGRDKQADMQHLEMMDSLLELQTFATMLEQGRIDELINELESAGLIPKGYYLPDEIRIAK